MLVGIYFKIILTGKRYGIEKKKDCLRQLVRLGNGYTVLILLATFLKMKKINRIL